LIADVAKGAAAIAVVGALVPWLAERLSQAPATAAEVQVWLPWAVCLGGLAVLLGHGRSIWLNFTGGKAAATGLGVLLALSWPVGLGAAAVSAVVLAISRIVSLGSLLAALTAAVLICVIAHPLPYRLLVIAGAAYVTVRHRANIRRLTAGTEPRLGRGTSDPGPP
jgi:acyl phosphate:glycerol-3-phosphate acyltransferase